MAPGVDPVVVTILPWPHFQAFLDAFPAIGGKLYGFVPSTTTPKALFMDPFLAMPHEAPVVLDDQGAATVYLNGQYDLRLFDATDVLIWQVDNYAFASGVTPSPGAVQVGTTQVTLTAIDQAAVLTASNLVPPGYRLLGVRTATTADFGTSRGLQALLIGDPVAEDRWGRQTVLTAVTGTTQADFHAGDCPVASGAGYTVLVAAAGGLYDSQGAILLTAHWERLLETATGDPSTGVETGAATVTLHATDGARVLTAGGLAPAGSRVLGVTTQVPESFGVSRGLTGLMIGDAIAEARWGMTTTLTASAVTTQGSFRSGDCPIAPTAYT
ncbi:MAG: hypothetical protein ACREN5_04495, partial [Gemmatimonadales bacterium]